MVLKLVMFGVFKFKIMKDIEILKGIMFFLAMSGTIYFVCNFLTWLVWKTNPTNFKKEITSSDILGYNTVMIISIFLWTLLYIF